VLQRRLVVITLAKVKWDGRTDLTDDATDIPVATVVDRRRSGWDEKGMDGRRPTGRAGNRPDGQAAKRAGKGTARRVEKVSWVALSL
jgi:hypothetical protein